jgi:hypothetical protein
VDSVLPTTECLTRALRAESRLAATYYHVSYIGEPLIPLTRTVLSSRAYWQN